MMQRWYLRAALSVLVGLGVSASLVRAQEPVPAPHAEQPGLAPVPTAEPWAVIEYGAGTAPTYGGGTPALAGYPGSSYPPPPDTPDVYRKGPFRDWARGCANKLGICCWSHHNSTTCSSWHSEFVFIFGSCRQFFGETCLKGPPQPPFPPGYGPLPDYNPTWGPNGYGYGYDHHGYNYSTGYNLDSPGYGGKGSCPNCQ
jgi:hypothetical protein